MTFFHLTVTFHLNDCFVPGPMSAGPIFNTFAWIIVEPPMLFLTVTHTFVFFHKSGQWDPDLATPLITAQHLTQGENLRLYIGPQSPLWFRIMFPLLPLLLLLFIDKI